ncbi:MAG: DNA polymerase III subunit beta [Actinomycetes bacterium]
MKFRVERDRLADAVAWAARALPTRPSIPTLSGLLLSSDQELLTLSGFNNENAASVEIEANIDEPGRVLVSGRMLADISRSLPNQPVVMATDGSRLEVRCGRSSFMLPTLPVEEYPVLPTMPSPAGVVDGSVFAAAVNQVAVAAGHDDTLPMLLGIRIEFDGPRVTMAATDRYRLAVRELTWRPENPAFEGSALVPAKVLADTAKLLGGSNDVFVAYAPNTPADGLMGFEGGGRRTTTRLIDGDFPKYRQLLPDSGSTFATVPTAGLLEAVKRVSLVAERSTPVRLLFSGDEVSLQAGSGDEAQATEALEAQVVGDPIAIAFNPAYLMEGLNVIGDPQVRIAFTESNKPAVLTPGDNDSAGSFQYLLMPVRLSS